MVNAKLGSLLTMEELSFPPKIPQSDEPEMAQKTDETEEEESFPILEYLGVCEEHEEPPPRGWDHYNILHEREIRKIRKRRGSMPPRECIASDGEVEIWRNPPNPKELAKGGWIVEKPEDYLPLAQAVGVHNYGKMFRQTDGTEIRGEKRFYSFRTPQTMMSSVEQLKTDQNKESWQDGDLSLANTDLRWLANVRGPIRSGFTPEVRPRGEFEKFRPIAIEEQWKPPLNGTGPRTYVLRAITGRGEFRQNIPPATKYECFIRGQHDEPPLSVQEEYQNPKVLDLIGKPPIRGNQRFSAVFPDRQTKPGTTDSMTVRKLAPTFP
jgi:hypothetical protein